MLIVWGMQAASAVRGQSAEERKNPDWTHARLLDSFIKAGAIVV
jgi:hypothetical protein